LLQENLEVLRELEEGNPDTTIKRFHALNLLGYLAINEEGDYARVLTLWEESLALAREVGDTDRVAIMLSNLGHPALLQGDYEQARTFSEEALAIAHELGSVRVEFAPTALINLGLAALGLGEHRQAMGSFKEALLLCQNMGEKPLIIDTLEGMASLAGATGEDSRAALLWGAAEAARQVTGIALLSPGERALHEPYLVLARSRLGEAAWEGALAEGQAMSLDEAAEYALSREVTGLPTISVAEEPQATEPLNELTRREREVAVLVARGLTNRQLASELIVSERTVENHVARILGKLGLHSRAQIATWATEHQLHTTPEPD
jgi:DNA-binding CsgD family transcriptional regulator/tetratricopeptide (TPR) repeat protein